MKPDRHSHTEDTRGMLLARPCCPVFKGNHPRARQSKAERLKKGVTPQDILDELPHLTRDDAMEALSLLETVLRNTMTRREIMIYDCTPREGMQTPGGIGANEQERIFAASHIANYADFVELGMPANPADYGFIKKTKERFLRDGKDCGIAVLCMNKKEDVDRSYEVLQGYHKTLCHVFIGTSEEHRKTRFGGTWTKEDYLREIRTVVNYASSKPFTHIMFSPEDAFRTYDESPDFFENIVDAAYEGFAAATPQAKPDNESKRESSFIFNAPDTVGKSTVREFMRVLRNIRKRYGDTIQLSLHCHNDSGEAQAQAMHAIEEGAAEWIQTVFGGYGERNGITSTEGLIAKLAKRGLIAGKPYASPKRLSKLVPATKNILAAYGLRVPEHAIISGDFTNVSTAGIHTDLAQNNPKAYHIYGDQYGAKPVIEFGPVSGTKQVKALLDLYDIKIPDKKMQGFVQELKCRCNEEKRHLYETDVLFEAIRSLPGYRQSMYIDKTYSMLFRGEKGGRDRSPRARFYLSGTYDGSPFSQVEKGYGDLETIIGGLQNVTQRYGHPFAFVGFLPKIIPKIPTTHLNWKQGEEPPLIEHLALDSSIKSSVIIQEQDGDKRLYYGTSIGEKTFGNITDSAIDAALKMVAIRDALRH